MNPLDTLFRLGVQHLWQGAAILAVAVVVVRLRPRWSAEERAWLWSAVLIGMTLLPLATLAPRWAPARIGVAPASIAAAPVVALDAAAAASVARAEASGGASLSRRAATWRAELETFAARPEARGAAGLLVVLWIAGTLVHLCRLLSAWHAGRALLRGARPFPLVTARTGTAPVFVSDAAPVPMAMGLRHPAIVLPARLAGADPRGLAHVIAHERAHLERGDVRWFAFERVLLALFWWSPAFHVAVGASLREREMACDDRAAWAAGDAGGYVLALIGAAEALTARGARSPALLAAGAFEHRGDFAARMRRLAAPGYCAPRGVSARRLAAAAAGLAALFSVIFIQTPRGLHAQGGDAVVGVARAADPDRSRGSRDPLAVALIEAAKQDDAEAVRVLLDAGADPDAAVDGDGTALIVASRIGSMALVELLLARGADVNRSSPGDGNPLIAAAAEGRLAIARRLIAAGADVNAVVPEDETPLINAAREGHLRIVELLIERGADVNRVVVTEAGEKRSALGMAGAGGHRDIVRLLRAKEAVR
jgi:beta-lactamase regulating signal transducer with metallopeptidase domain